MSRLPPITIPQESNLPLVIEFTRESPTFTRQARIDALEGLVERCSRAINTCLEATDTALATIETGDQHRARLDRARADLPADIYRGFFKMTDDVRQHSRAELEAIGRNLRALRECKRAAEQGRECGFPPLFFPSFPTQMTVGVMADGERSYSCRG